MWDAVLFGVVVRPGCDARVEGVWVRGGVGAGGARHGPAKHATCECPQARASHRRRLPGTNKGDSFMKRVQTHTMTIYTGPKLNREIGPQLALESVSRGVWH